MTCQEAVDLMGPALEDELASASRPGFDEHMDECRPCATYLEHLRVARLATRQALLQLPPERRTNPRRDELLDAFRRELGRE